MKRITSLLFILCFTNSIFGQIINIPDPNFKNALVNTNCVILDDDLNGDADADLNDDGEIDVNEALLVQKLNVNLQNISSMEGLEYFTNLTFLTCILNGLQELDVSANVNLETLVCAKNQLTELDVSNNINLKELECYTNSLSTLDVSQNEQLVDLRCFHNQIQSINFPSNSLLQSVYAEGNHLFSIDISSLDELVYADFKSCFLDGIDISNNLNLEEFKISNNFLTSLDVSNNSNLKSLNIHSNELTQIDISNNPNLESLRCSSNQIDEIISNVSPNLRTLNCDNNILNNLILSDFPNLTNLRCRFNQLTQLDISSNNQLVNVECSDNQIDDIVFFNNSNIIELVAEGNQLTTLDLSECPNLERMSLAENNISELNLSNNIDLELIYLMENSIENIDLSANVNLQIANISSNSLNQLDLSNNTELLGLAINDNPIETLFLKNGSAIQSESLIFFENTPNLTYICIDDDEIDLFLTKIEEYGYTDVVVNTYCSFTPGGDYNEFRGTVSLDIDSDGCDSDDFNIPYFRLETSGNSETGTVFTSSEGEFVQYLEDGNFIVQPMLEFPEYFEVSPPIVSLNFPFDTNPFEQDFCVTASPTGVHSDLEVTIVPITLAVPGFDSEYKVIYKNKGNIALSGTINLDFEDDYMDFLVASPTEDIITAGNLQWNYSDLLPFETREIDLSFTLNTPTDPNFPLNSDDILNFAASIDPIEVDETPGDNSFSLSQVVVNAYDPNDIRCLEGESILPDHVGKYVHYLIRFENLGTANAVNVVVKDSIDQTKFDISSLVPLSSSHNFVTRISDGHIVEFIFENIQLPFDDANNDGYILFKIKTLETLQLGDSFTNEAEIYFDFNFPVITNAYTTIINENLSVEDVQTNSISLFPNPAKQILKVNSLQVLDKIRIVDINGRVVQSEKINSVDNEYVLNLNDLLAGIYFLETYSSGNKVVSKFIKL